MASRITKTFTGFCPKSQTEKTISIDYVVGSTVDGFEFSAKGRYDCSDNSCSAQDCPIYKNAPDSI